MAHDNEILKRSMPRWSEVWVEFGSLIDRISNGMKTHFTISIEYFYLILFVMIFKCIYSIETWQSTVSVWNRFKFNDSFFTCAVRTFDCDNIYRGLPPILWTYFRIFYEHVLAFVQCCIRRWTSSNYNLATVPNNNRKGISQFRYLMIQVSDNFVRLSTSVNPHVNW